METIRCGKCKLEKSSQDFSPSQRKNGRWCRDCTNSYKKTPVQRAKIAAQTRDYRFRIGETVNPRPTRSIDKEGQDCATCFVHKTWDQFYDDKTNTKTGKRATCKQCVMDKQVVRLLKKNFNITLEQYNLMLEEQNQVCFLCEEPEVKSSFNSELTDRLAVDHWHGCQEGHKPEQGCVKCIRGVLCSSCNILIGRIEIKSKLVPLFSAYLQRRPLST